jgi:hypothetical protein
LEDLGELLGANGCRDTAEYLARSINERTWRTYFLKGVVKGLASHGDYDAALRIALAMQSYRSTSMSEIARCQAERKQFEQAFATAELLRDKPEGVSGVDECLAGIGRAQVRLGSVVEAKATLTRIQSPYYRTNVLTDIAVAQATAGDLESARATLADVTRMAAEQKLSGSVKELVEALLKIGERASAAVTAGLLSPWEQQQKLADIGLAMIEAGEIEEACRIAERLADRGSGFFTNIAAGLADAHQLGAINRLLISAAKARETAQEFCLLLAELHHDQARPILERIGRMLGQGKPELVSA